MFAKNSFVQIIRTSAIALVALIAFAIASPAQAEERTPESSVCDANPNAYFASIRATEEMIDDRVGHENWQVGQYYLMGEEILENGWVLQFWIHIVGVDEHGNYTIVEYYYFPHCNERPFYSQFDDLLVHKYVNPKLEVISTSRITAMGQPTVVDETVDVEVKEDDDSYPPDPIEPSNDGDNQGVVTDDGGDDSGPVIVITEDNGDLILVPITIPVIP
ncbi:MAG: hypothetical protein DWQ07_06605 [Chloroflexi bacterium]|nr:MAG: hypothetical protein DWQ07_06605 [Chloroflexota bacterium]MBL1195899.1 hypothetical protein [Chloroflexota bacterium]NOH13191.1 hypothetical protein [Chloroflexota bacterium]